MSPDELSEIASAAEVRSKFAFIFECVIRLYEMQIGKRPSKRFEEAVRTTEELYNREFISDYLHENLKMVYELYPTMLPGKVAEGYEKNRQAEEERLIKLSKLLGIFIGDLCGEIQELSDKASLHDREQLALYIKCGYNNWKTIPGEILGFLLLKYLKKWKIIKYRVFTFLLFQNIR